MRLSLIFILFLFFWTIICLLLDPICGLLVGLCSFTLLLPIYLARKDAVLMPFALFTSSAIFLTCLLRTPFLILDPSVFIYHRLAEPSIVSIRTGLQTLLGFQSLLVAGLAIPLRNPLCTKKRITDDGVRYIPNNYLNLFSENRYLIYGIFFAAIIGRFIAMKAFNIGVMVGERQYGFLDRILPYVSVIFLVATFAVLSWRRLTVRDRVICSLIVVTLLAYSVLITSKAGIGYILFAIFTTALFRYSDFKIPVRYATFLLLGGMFMVFFLFPFTMEYRFVVSYSADSGLSSITEALKRLGEKDGGIQLLEQFSSRLSAFDGIISLGYVESENLKSYFSPVPIAKSILQGLLPGIHFGDISCGKGVGLIYQGHASTTLHSGSIGLFAASHLMLNTLSYPFIFILGWLWSSCFRFIWRFLATYDYRYYFCTLYAFLTQRLLMSGNFDIITVKIVERVLHAVLIILLIQGVGKFANRRRTRGLRRKIEDSSTP